MMRHELNSVKSLAESNGLNYIFEFSRCQAELIEV